MKIPLQVTITPVGKLAGYPSLDRAEEFMRQLLNSDAARELAIACQVEPPGYTPEHPSKLHRQLGFSHTSDAHTFSCWEQEGGEARKVADFPTLSPAAIFNGDQARDWVKVQAGGTKREDEAGIHLLYRDGQLIKKLWIEADRKEG